MSCDLCGRELFGTHPHDTHPCCLRFWTAEKGCPACNESRWARSEWIRRHTVNHRGAA